MHAVGLKGSGDFSMIAPSLTGRLKRWVLGFVLVLPVYTFHAVAAQSSDAVPPSNFVQQPAISVEQATAIARRQTGGGRVLSAAPVEGGNRGYRVRVLLEGGRVTTVVTDRAGGVREGR
jgi:hypothetical protein